METKENKKGKESKKKTIENKKDVKIVNQAGFDAQKVEKESADCGLCPDMYPPGS